MSFRIARAVLVAEHVHERAVVDAVHAERPDEVALEHPERLGQQERAGHLGRDPVDDLAPELGRHPRRRTRPGVMAYSARDGMPSPRARQRPPQPLDVLAWRGPSRRRSG